MTKPKTSDQKTEWMMPRGTEPRASRVSSDVCAEASKPVIVERVEKADEKGDQSGPRLGTYPPPGSPVLRRGCQAGEIPGGAPDQEHRRQHDRDDQDQVAGEVRQHRGDLDAEMVDQRLRCNDQGYGTRPAHSRRGY